MVEIVRPGASSPDAKVALFDFDGTLSLIRTGWLNVMVPMMVQILAELKTGESEAELRRTVEDYVWRLTGRETVYQMMALADEVKLRGGSPPDPLVYKKRYLDLLSGVIRDRLEELRRGGALPGDRESRRKADRGSASCRPEGPVANRRGASLHRPGPSSGTRSRGR